MAVPCNVVDIDVGGKESRYPFWLRWSRTSNEHLKEAEKKLISRIKSNVEAFFVPIFNGSCYIRTFVCRGFKSSQPAHENKVNNENVLPIVLIHGFGSGSALWCKNIDALAHYRTVYSLDVLGFGRSSRPSFPADAVAVEEKWVESIEEWRSSLNIEKFILLGHSLGGFLACSYSLTYPQRVAHLILADPWGFVEDPLKAKEHSNVGLAQAWMFSTIRHIFRPFNPLTFLRAAGPFGPTLIHHFRQDLRGFFDQRPIRDGEILEIPPEEQLKSTGSMSFDDQIQSTDGEDNGAFELSSTEDKTLKTSATHKTTSGSVGSLGFDDLDGSVALDYVITLTVNIQEAGFKSLCSSVGWPQRPMLDRIAQLDASLPVTFIYGSRSWMDMSSGHKTRALRPNSYVDVKVIEGAGHQVYAQMSEEFNAYVNKIGQRVDNNDPFTPGDYCPPVNNSKQMNNPNENTNSPTDNSNRSTKGHNGRIRRKRSSVALVTQDTSSHLYGRLNHNGNSDAKNVEKDAEASDEASD